MKDSYKIFTINPGSTSTKIALIENDKVLFSKNVSHDASKLAEFDGISAQLPYRLETILNLLKESNISLEGIDACVGRGGGLIAMAAAKATLGRLAELGLDAHAEELGSYLRERLAEVPYVSEVRGKGLMVGATIEGKDAHDVVGALLDEGIVANACNGEVLRFLPPLIIEREHVDALIEALRTL